MTRRRWRWDAETREMVEVEVYRETYDGHYIIPDVEPFQSPIDGSVVGSRKQMRSHMDKHNVVPFEKLTPRSREREEKAARIEALRSSFERHRDERYAKTRR